MKNYLITGGCGFIGSNFCHLLSKNNKNIFVLDKLTYAANKDNINGIEHKFYQGDIGNYELVLNILIENSIDVIVNFAAETHVDNSIINPGIFIETNIVGTYNLLQVSYNYQKNYNENLKFIHVSTDEVFGSLQVNDERFNEETSYSPSSPYSASKAASDHLIRSWICTYNFNAMITNCSNNYGKFQYNEKLIPKTIDCCRNKKSIIIYGNGENIRDWIFVEDHCMGIYLVIENFQKGESYCFGGDCEKTNLEVVIMICKIFQEKDPSFDYKSLLMFVEDRKGHDFRYAVNSQKAIKNLNFDNKKGRDFETNLYNLIYEN